jgi:hypothetical protein
MGVHPPLNRPLCRWEMVGPARDILRSDDFTGGDRRILSGRGLINIAEDAPGHGAGGRARLYAIKTSGLSVQIGRSRDTARNRV